MVISSYLEHCKSSRGDCRNNARWTAPFEPSQSAWAISPPVNTTLIGQAVSWTSCLWAWPVRRQTYGYLPSHRAFTAPWPVPNYTAWWQRHMGVNNLPRVAARNAPAESRTCNLSIVSPMPYHNTTESPSPLLGPKADTHFTILRRVKFSIGSWSHTQMLYPSVVTHPISNWAQCRLTWCVCVCVQGQHRVRRWINNRNGRRWRSTTYSTMMTRK